MWPDRATTKQNIPLAFQQLYPNCRVIIDFSDILIETPSSFEARSQTYSNYKNNMVKFLLLVALSVTCHIFGVDCIRQNDHTRVHFLISS